VEPSRKTDHEDTKEKGGENGDGAILILEIFRGRCACELFDCGVIYERRGSENL
jgi:hypothetical protein